MTTYRKYNWPELFALFEQSGLSQTEFCKQHNVNAKYFSQKRLLSLGKKTARFYRASANLYSLIETAKANGVNPYEYLKQVFTRLPNMTTKDNLDELIPWCIEIA